MQPYDYWLVANRDDIFSLSQAAYVAASDPGYTAFLAGGALPHRIASDGELAHLLQQGRYSGPTIAAAAGSAPDWGHTLGAADICNVLIAMGVAVTSSGTPSLDGTYATDATAQAKINAVATYIAVNSKFPAGQTSLAWPDIAGTPHVFATTAQFQAFATAIGDYVAGLDLAAAEPTPSWPAASVTIA